MIRELDGIRLTEGVVLKWIFVRLHATVSGPYKCYNVKD